MAHLKMVYLLDMVIVHGYVKKPDGISYCTPIIPTQIWYNTMMYLEISKI